MAAQATVDQWIPEIVDRLVREFDPVKIVLFGSHARGDASEYSDLDLLVVLAELTPKRREVFAVRDAIGDVPLSTDVVVTSPEEIARRGDLVGTVLRPALREGRVLYERG